ncbi:MULTISPECIES: hypothetical protein [Pseudomonadota]|jgi:hypothetical protein|uniref:hypothetical protein n=1 Tax=Pseudomonadota TaxID=1224 RepID=UPI000AAA352D|nr:MULTISPECIES: hypothetical protein [Pseudomonadota]|tara:strand:+ start:251273 stop:251473 length:201 start_codon:yes stop_codon:yes gene_type:complete
MGVISECLKGKGERLADKQPVAAMRAPIIIGRARQLAITLRQLVHHGVAKRAASPYRRASLLPQAR